MEEEITKLAQFMAELREVMDTFVTTLGNTPAPTEVREGVRSAYENFQSFAINLESGNIDGLVASANTAGIYAQSIGQNTNRISSSSPDVQDVVSRSQYLQTIGMRIQEFVRSSTISHKPLDSLPKVPLISSSPEQYFKVNEISDLEKERRAQDQRIKEMLNESELKITGLQSQIKSLEENLGHEIKKAVALYDSGVTEIATRSKEIGDILGHVSGRAIAGDYEKSASGEQVMADYLRYGSIFCMSIIAIAVGYSFWETTQREFHWETSLVRFALTFLLSVPAAYLAKESAKHRNQQYAHLQTSLDLKAISPFMASLPDEDQHKLKIAIASKIFSGRESVDNSKDAFPLDAQAIIMELVKKVGPAPAK